MKLTREELLKKIAESEGLSEDIKIMFMEDVADSFENGLSEADLETVKNLEKALEDLDKDYRDLQEKYKARFLSGEEVVEETEETEETEDVIDVKEI